MDKNVTFKFKVTKKNKDNNRNKKLNHVQKHRESSVPEQVLQFK